VREHLESLAEQFSFELVMHEVDLVRGSDQDVLQEEYWKSLIQQIRDLRPFCIIATPPCSTFSRARHLYKRHPGPRPIRSRQFPEGFPWLTDAKREQAQQGTKLAKRAWELSELADEMGSTFLSEFPEDLGLTDTGVPASLWQMPEFTQALMRKGMHTFALFQCEFGAATPKPTRFLSDLQHFEGVFYPGIPQFDKDWKYKGPLPRGCPHAGQHDALIGLGEDGQWKTAPAAHYPDQLCAFLARAIYKSWKDTSSVDMGVVASEVLEQVQLDEQDQVAQPEPLVEIMSGCEGPPMTAKYAGRSEQFCDGLGLCSPGRWHPSRRQLKRTSQQQKFCQDLAGILDRFCLRKLGDLAKATMQLALGRFQSSPFTAGDLDELRTEWFQLLPEPEKAGETPEGQPFFLGALAQSLRLMGDPDTDIIDNQVGSNFTEGVHLGHESPLGPTPQVYRPREKDPIYDETHWSLCMGNYFRGSEAEAEKILEEHFREEELEGRMKPISQKEAAKQYPGKALRIAAQGILDKPDGGHRIIHDGTHGVRLNNEIQVLDKLENPGPRELATIMKASAEAGEHVIFAINADIAKAHRRVRVRPSDWGVQACKTSSSAKVVWLNKTGTFGVSSAAYWWSRLMGLVGRHAINLMGNGWFFVLIFVDDLHLASGGKNRWAQIWRFIAALEMTGTPFSYKKFRGGFTMDYVGYWLDYSRFEMGMSERRTAWLVEFIDRLEADQWLVMARRYQEFHGRLGFAAQVLPWLRPLLAPGYAWLAAIGKATTAKVPEMLALVCIFIRKKFLGGLRKIQCVESETYLGEVFRTDAKCEDGLVVLGGWTLGSTGNPKLAQWFALEVKPSQAPWLFRGAAQESSWASTSAELLASLVALKVFQVGGHPSAPGSAHLLRCGGGTDNRSTGQLVQRRLSTKWPVMILLMDYLGYCEEIGVRCELDWRPRDANVEADQLTNNDFSAFSMERRIKIEWEELNFPMVDLLMKYSESFSKRKHEVLDDVASRRGPKFTKSTWG